MASVDNEIRGRLALITGASGGIGAACARDLFAHGAHLALTYSTQPARVDELIASLRAEDSTRRLSAHQADMAQPAHLQRVFDELQTAHGQAGPDILVSNAGHGRRIVRLADIPLAEFEYTLAVNLRAAFILSQLAEKHMAAQRWGRIVFVSSIAARGGGINGCHYAASKAGLTGLMRNLAARLAPEGISVNDVAPAMIRDTGMIPDEAAVRGTAGDVANIPLGRLGTPAECANVVTMLCRTGYMTGQSLLLAGGLK